MDNAAQAKTIEAAKVAPHSSAALPKHPFTAHIYLRQQAAGTATPTNTSMPLPSVSNGPSPAMSRNTPASAAASAATKLGGKVVRDAVCYCCLLLLLLCDAAWCCALT